MSEPEFLGLEQVERLHRKLIDRFGGTHGLRDRSLLESAIMQPRNVHYYAQGDAFNIAAAYAFHVAQAQAFLDGNKRAGIGAALLFLESCGFTLPIAAAPLFEAMIAIAERRMDKPQLAALFRQLAAQG